MQWLATGVGRKPIYVSGSESIGSKRTCYPESRWKRRGSVQRRDRGYEIHRGVFYNLVSWSSQASRLPVSFQYSWHPYLFLCTYEFHKFRTILWRSVRTTSRIIFETIVFLLFFFFFFFGKDQNYIFWKRNHLNQSAAKKVRYDFHFFFLVFNENLL